MKNKKQKIKNNIFSLWGLYFLGITCFFFTSCDSGDIYPTDEKPTGVSIDASFRFQNIEAFPTTDYELFLGIFDNESTVPLTSKNISKPQENAIVNISLDNVPANSSYVRLCLAQSGKKTLHVFYEVPANLTSANEIKIQEKVIDLLEYSRIQQQVFRQCVACHGGSSTAAGNLFLTPERSYADLVDVPSQKSDKKRVKPADPANSFLIDVLTKDDVGFRYPHTTGLSSLKSEDISLLKEWIKTIE